MWDFCESVPVWIGLSVRLRWRVVTWTFCKAVLAGARKKQWAFCQAVRAGATKAFCLYVPFWIGLSVRLCWRRGVVETEEPRDRPTSQSKWHSLQAEFGSRKSAVSFLEGNSRQTREGLGVLSLPFWGALQSVRGGGPILVFLRSHSKSKSGGPLLVLLEPLQIVERLGEPSLPEPISIAPGRENSPDREGLGSPIVVLLRARSKL